LKRAELLQNNIFDNPTNYRILISYGEASSEKATRMGVWDEEEFGSMYPDLGSHLFKLKCYASRGQSG
jgi:hypothetical protein